MTTGTPIYDLDKERITLFVNTDGTTWNTSMYEKRRTSANHPKNFKKYSLSRRTRTFCPSQPRQEVVVCTRNKTRQIRPGLLALVGSFFHGTTTSIFIKQKIAQQLGERGVRRYFLYHRRKWRALFMDTENMNRIALFKKRKMPVFSSDGLKTNEPSYTLLCTISFPKALQSFLEGLSAKPRKAPYPN